jgi:hypothetical protein
MHSYANCEDLPVSLLLADNGSRGSCNFHVANGTVTSQNTKLRRTHNSG